MNFEKLENFLEKNKEQKFRYKQIKKAVFKDSIIDFSDITNIPKELRKLLALNFKILPFSLEKILSDKKEGAFKAILKLHRGDFIETVLLFQEKGNWSCCISCQAGCALGCKFCATGQGGLKNNLTEDEIACQILFWQNYLKKNQLKGTLSNVVYMGMGEPFLNWENVKESLEILSASDKFAFASRSISISTVGIPQGIREFGKSFPQMNLAISLHFADDNKRSKYMPINKKYNLRRLKEAIEDYFTFANRKIFIEYLMMKGINDGISDAEILIDYLKSFKNSNLLHVNLIPYNSVVKKISSSPEKTVFAFADYLRKNKIHITVRRSIGKAVKGACGQLGGIKV